MLARVRRRGKRTPDCTILSSTVLTVNKCFHLADDSLRDAWKRRESEAALTFKLIISWTSERSKFFREFPGFCKKKRETYLLFGNYFQAFDEFHLERMPCLLTGFDRAVQPFLVFNRLDKPCAASIEYARCRHSSSFSLNLSLLLSARFQIIRCYP